MNYINDTIGIMDINPVLFLAEYFIADRVLTGLSVQNTD